ncbi:MAG: tetratricopeptide repeat protein [Verrucomicrobia bacterium]|nr:tetratricopeptide repeat protein [Verrucomicrobiota bacterium]
MWTWQRNRLWANPVLLWSDNALKSPGIARVHANLGNALQEAGRYREAAVEFEKALQLDPRLVGVYNNLARICMDQLQRNDLARLYLNAALKLNPDVPELHLNLGVIALRENNPSEAARAFRRVLELQPHDVQAHYNLTICHASMGDIPKALATVDWSLGYCPDSARLHLLKARVHLKAGNRQAAREALAKARALQPNDPETERLFQQIP